MVIPFLAPTGELYELLCHRREKERERKSKRERTQQNECFCNNLDPAHLIWTKFGMDIQLDPRNKPAEEFFIFLKIQDGLRRSKVQNRSNLTPQITFRLWIWIWLIRFGQYLAWTYYLTLGTTPRKNFSFFSKSKMAATAITANYEIAHNLKSIHLETQFFPSTHVFKGKECNEAIICVLRS